ncbi:MAG TPA: hypothetical protein VIX80_10740 [Candidatus Kapabacteria bacterium]
MKESSDIEKNIDSLERELRAMGEPYSTDTPSDEYFADFQSRLMSRIASEQVATAPKKTVSPVSSPMRITVLVGVMVLVVAGFFYFNGPNNSTAPTGQATTTEASKAIDNETLYDINVNQTKPEAQQNLRSMQDTNPPKVTEATKQPVRPTVPAVKPMKADQSDMLNGSADFEKIDEVLIGEPDAPVTYDKLTTDELEAVLKVLDAHEFEDERNGK